MKRIKPDSKQRSMFNFISNSDENNNSVNQIDNSPDQADIPDEEFFFATPLVCQTMKKHRLLIESLLSSHSGSRHALG